MLLQTALIFVYRTLTTIAFYFFYMILMEYFPTQVRSFAFLLTGLAGALGNMVVPLVQTAFQQARLSVFLSFGICSALIVLLSAFFPETYGTEPPEIIAELR